MASSSASTRAIIGMLVVAALAVAFWILAFSPKQKQADDLSVQIEQQQTSLAEAQGQVAAAKVARSEFANDYRQLVVLGKAVPANDETASLLVEVNRIADRAKVRFESLDLISGGGSAAETAPAAPAASATTAVPTSSTLPPTEAEAALLPLGSAIGSAGLGVMPYSLTFTGSFFQVADFIGGIDSLVDSGETEVGVDGRLITLDGFALVEDDIAGFPDLKATFAVTTYVVPPSQGITAGATATSPATAVSTAGAETATGTPSSYSTESAR
jgi:Tfp pilus assembly protein PilO